MQGTIGHQVIKFGLTVLAFTITSVFTTAPLMAQANFYQGKTLTIINGNEPGGTADRRMRAVIPYLKKYLPGQPSIVAEYMPGGGGRKVTNHIFSRAKADGLVLGFPPGSIITYALFKETGVSYDINKLIYVGSPESSTQYVFLTRKEANIDTLDKLRATKGLRIGAQSVGHSIYIIGRLFAHVLGLNDAKFITGFSGPEVDFAVQRGEVDARANIPDTILQRSPEFIRDRLVDFHAIIEIPRGDKHKHPAFSKLPELSNLAKTDLDKKVINLFRSLRVVGSPFLLPPNTPKERVAQMRDAFGKTAADPNFHKDYKKLVGDDPSPLSSEGIENALKELPAEESVIDFFKQVSGSGPLPKS